MTPEELREACDMTNISRRTLLAGAAAAGLLPTMATARSTNYVQNLDYLDIDIPDAETVTVRLTDIQPHYPGTNGGRIDMHAIFQDGVDNLNGSYTWAFQEVWDGGNVIYGASSTDHNMTDRVRLCTATLQSLSAASELTLTFTNPGRSDRHKMWRWTGTTLYLDGRVCGYAGYAAWYSPVGLRGIRLFPDVGTFSMNYKVTAEN